MTEFATAIGDTGKSMLKIIFILAILAVVGIAIAYISEKPQHDYKSVVNQEDLKDEKVDLNWVSNTEYTTKDSNGSTIVKLRDSKNNFINTNCSETILYPNRTVYMDWTPMYQDLVYGEYYLNFEIPDTSGVYSQEVSCLIKNNNVSSAKAFHISALGDRILASTNSLNGTLELLKQAINCSNPTLNRTCELLSQLNGSSTTNFYNTNQSLTQLTSIVTSINETVSGLGKIYYRISANSCVQGTYWTFDANVSNEAGQILPFLDCTLITIPYGTENVPFNTALNRYRVVHPCFPAGVMQWDFNCVKT